MKTLSQFGFASPQLYSFPTDAQVSYNDNFAEIVTRTNRMPGADGGLDEYGNERSPHEVGTISAEFWLHYDSPDEETSKLEAFRQMGDWGKQLLYMQPTGQRGTERWCWARVNNINTSQNANDVPHKRQRAKIIFQASDPFWYGAGNQKLWDSTYDWDSTINWDDGSFTAITGSGNMTVTPSGNAETLGRFVAKVTGAQSFSRLIVERLANSVIVDQAILQMGLAQNDVIEIDPRRQWVVVNGENRIANFDFMHPDWLRLVSGANTVRVRLDEPTAAISAIVYYFDRYT